MSDAQPDLERGVYRVSHLMVVGKTRFLAESDLIFENGEPFVVLEWTPPNGDDPPTIKLPLDLERLTPIQPQGFFSYDGDIIDPRQVQ